MRGALRNDRAEFASQCLQLGSFPSLDFGLVGRFIALGVIRVLATNLLHTLGVEDKGEEKKFADVGFRGGDDMFLLFRSPVDGYVAAYLVDETPVAYCLLPYIDDADGQQPVEHGREYIFFSEAKAEEESGKVDEYTLTCGSDIERNRLYVIFSPEPFTKALDSQISDALPRQLSYEDFGKWLGTCRKRDKKMGVKVMHIEIKK